MKFVKVVRTQSVPTYPLQIFVLAIYDGMLKSMIRTATNSFLGEGQIHAKGFTDTNEVELSIRGFSRVMQSLEKEDMIEAFTPRTISFGMLTSPSDVTTAMVYGIDPEREPPLSKLDEALREGEYIGPDDFRGILVGSKAAENLALSTGDFVYDNEKLKSTGYEFIYPDPRPGLHDTVQWYRDQGWI